MEGNGDSVHYCRIQAEEALRLGNDAGNHLIEWCYIEAQGLDPDDHADSIQGYDSSPGGNGTTTLRNTTLVIGGYSTGAYFPADGWSGNHIFENVLVIGLENGGGGQRGVHIPIDGGGNVSFNGVYIVGYFPIGDLIIDRPILQWENVFEATIVDGELIVGDPIPEP